MINLVLSTITIILLFFQVLYPARLLLFGTMPDFFLTLIIFLSLYSKNERTFFWAVILGGLKDLLSAEIFGINILSFSLISVIMARIEARFFFRDRIRSLLIFVLCISFLHGLLSYVLRILFGSGNFLLFYCFRISLLQAVTTACWSIPLIYIFKKCALEFFTPQS